MFGESRKANRPLRGNDANVGTKSVTERDKNAAAMNFEICLQSTPKGRKWEDQQKSDRLAYDENITRKLLRSLVYKSYHSMMKPDNCKSFVKEY